MRFRTRLKYPKLFRDALALKHDKSSFESAWYLRLEFGKGDCYGIQISVLLLTMARSRIMSWINNFERVVGQSSDNNRRKLYFVCISQSKGVR